MNLTEIGISGIVLVGIGAMLLVYGVVLIVYDMS